MAVSVDSALAPDLNTIPKLDTHPTDRIYQSIRCIRGLSIILGYVSEKTEADHDGPGSMYVEACLDAVNLFAIHIEQAMDELLNAEDREPKAELAA